MRAGRGRDAWWARPSNLAKGSNPRFVVTSIPADEIDAATLYENEYCRRGEMENRIKEQQLYLFADRTSTTRMRSNQIRLWFSSAAYALVQAFRRLGLKGTRMAKGPVPQRSDCGCSRSARWCGSPCGVCGCRGQRATHTKTSLHRSTPSSSVCVRFDYASNRQLRVVHESNLQPRAVEVCAGMDKRGTAPPQIRQKRHCWSLQGLFVHA